MTSSDRIKCRFCDWSTPRHPVKHKTGSASSAMSRLEFHIEDKHPVEHDAIYIEGRAP
jgi:hypothetical protein